MKIIPVANPNIGKDEAQSAYKVIKSGWVSMGKKYLNLKAKLQILLTQNTLLP